MPALRLLQVSQTSRSGAGSVCGALQRGLSTVASCALSFRIVAPGVLEQRWGAGPLGLPVPARRAVPARRGRLRGCSGATACMPPKQGLQAHPELASAGSAAVGRGMPGAGMGQGVRRRRVWCCPETTAPTACTHRLGAGRLTRARGAGAAVHLLAAHGPQPRRPACAGDRPHVRACGSRGVLRACCGRAVAACVPAAPRGVLRACCGRAVAACVPACTVAAASPVKLRSQTALQLRGPGGIRLQLRDAALASRGRQRCGSERA